MPVFRQPMKHRSGVTLLEVLISIGVTSIGLLGVMALIPLGGAQTRQGQVSERAPVIAMSAFAEIRNRDMLSTSNWLTATSTVPTAGPIPVPFCLDPLGIAYDTTNAPTRFPQTATVYMDRLTTGNGGSATAMTLPMAKAIFQSQDDLRIAESPTDRSMPAQQIWNLTRSSTDPASRRQTEGSMSWLTTIHPNTAANYGVGSDVFTVSVVVMHRRILDPTLQTEFTTNEMNTSTDFPGAGISGGDVILNFPNVDQAREAKTPESSWLLLSGRVRDPLIGSDGQPLRDAAGNPVYVKIFQWYRVLASDQTSNTQRQVTLSGPDWNLSLDKVQATIIPGTIAVYQRNMQLEGPTLWRN